MWRPPKIDWVSTDFFRFEDWVRITENCTFLSNLLEQPPTLANTTLADHNSLPFYNIVNSLEQNLDKLCNAFKYSMVQFEPTIWYPITSNSWTHNPSFEDFNRWENLTYKLYQMYISTITWGEAREQYITWGGTKGLTWELAAHGTSAPQSGKSWFTIRLIK